MMPIATHAKIHPFFGPVTNTTGAKCWIFIGHNPGAPYRIVIDSG
jgi:hypothetical protein